MLSLETERRIAQLFYILSQGEKQVEASRQNLCQNREFEPYSAFKGLDRTGLGSLSSLDLLSFLERNRIYVTDQEVQLLIKEYDANSDGRLSLNEFTQLSLPSANQLLRDLTSARPAYSRVALDVEYLLLRLLETEIQVQRDIEVAKKDLVSRYDFNLLDAYRAVDIRRSGGIDRDSMFSFLRRHEYAVLDDDLDAIYRRLDNDEDGLISYGEFSNGVLPNDPYRASGGLASSVGFGEVRRSSSPLRRSPSRSSPLRESPSRVATMSSPSRSFYEPRASSPLRQSPSRSQYQPRASSPLRQSPLRSSPLRSSPLRRSGIQESPARRSSPLRRSPLGESSYTSPVKTASGYKSPEKTSSSLRRSRNSSSKKSDYNSPQKSYLGSASKSGRLSYSEFSVHEEKELVFTLQEQIRLARDLEKFKVELSLKPDFNLIDAFRIFDLNDRSSITTLDIESAIQDIAPMALRDEVYLLIRHYSSLQDGQLRFSDFSELFTPKSHDYARLLKNREPYNVSYAQRRRVFSRDTTVLFVEILKLHLEAERVAESLRQRLARRPEFNMHEAFQAIDCDKNGFITIDEFRNILENNNIFANSKDLEALMQRYDRNKDGRVSYSEFVQEVTPKSPRKY